MAERGVICRHCGASTPLPEDLSTPTFRCAFCQAEIETASVAGQQAATADALAGHLHRVLKDPTITPEESVRTAPRFKDENAETRPSKCTACKAPVDVPMNITVNFFDCPSCGAHQSTDQHVPQQVRFEADMARQIAGNEAFKRLKAEGVPCLKCGAKNDVPDDGSVQLECRFCKATILLSDHVDPGAIARSRLKHAVYGFRDEAMRQGEEKQRRARVITAVVVALMVAVIVVINLVGGSHR